MDVNTVSLGHGELEGARKSSGFFACSTPDGVGGQGGLRRVGRPSSAARSADECRTVATSDAGSSVPRTLPGALSAAKAEPVEIGCCATLSTCYSAAMGVDAATSDQRKSVPSIHMRCMTTASRRARATFAAFTLPLFAIRMAQDLSDDQRP